MGDGHTSGLLGRYGEVYRFVRRRSPNAAEADDLTQQVFADAVAALDGRDPSDDLGLLFTIARRRLIDQLRRPGPTLVPLSEADGDVPITEYDPALTGMISDAIHQLGPVDREVVVLKLLRGLSFAETASIVGTSEAACKMRLRRALELLRRDLREKGVHQ